MYASIKGTNKTHMTLCKTHNSNNFINYPYTLPLLFIPFFILSRLQTTKCVGESEVQHQQGVSDLGKLGAGPDPGGVSGGQQRNDHHLQLQQLQLHLQPADLWGDLHHQRGRPHKYMQQ